MKEFALSVDQFGKIQSPAPNVGLNPILQTILSLIILGAIFLSFLYLIWGALDYIMAEGDKQRIQNARHKFIFAIMGLVLVLLSFFVVSIFGSIFGIKFFFPGIPQPVCPGGICPSP